MAAWFNETGSIILPPEDANLAPMLSDLVVRSNSSDGEPNRRLPPTIEACAELQFAYSYFNEALFDGALPHSLLTYTRRRNVLGYFAPDRFERSNGELWAEVSLNAIYLALRNDRESLSTLVHEQVHVWRHYIGPVNRRGGRGARGYHDRVWADRMEQVGLMPSHTGKPGGDRTGHQMTHYIIEGGPFDRACTALLDAGFQINWHDRVVRRDVQAGVNGSDAPSNPATKPATRKDRIKFTCRVCGLNAWAKPSAHLGCTDCAVPMLPADQ